MFSRNFITRLFHCFECVEIMVCIKYSTGSMLQCGENGSWLKIHWLENEYIATFLHALDAKLKVLFKFSSHYKNSGIDMEKGPCNLDPHLNISQCLNFVAVIRMQENWSFMWSIFAFCLFYKIFILSTNIS